MLEIDRGEGAEHQAYSDDGVYIYSSKESATMRPGLRCPKGKVKIGLLVDTVHRAVVLCDKAV